MFFVTISRLPRTAALPALTHTFCFVNIDTPVFNWLVVHNGLCMRKRESLTARTRSGQTFGATELAVLISFQKGSVQCVVLVTVHLWPEADASTFLGGDLLMSRAINRTWRK